MAEIISSVPAQQQQSIRTGQIALAATVLLLAALATPTLAQTNPSDTVWLCRPGMDPEPCTATMDSTAVAADGSRTTQSVTASANSAFDCFYVYPTVSTEPSANADLTIQPAEVAAAVAQASRFSEVCQVWAPMYRQRTTTSLLTGLLNSAGTEQIAYASVLAASNDYIANDNNGRPIICIGHSPQGGAMLIRLLAEQVDPRPALLEQTVVAILVGANVTVPSGGTVGASFQNLPLCGAANQTGCVIAYSSFPSQPPANAFFGRAGLGVSLQSGQTATGGVQVACVNPAALDGGSGAPDGL